MLGKHRIPALLNDDVIACRRKYADSHVTSSCAASMSEKLAELLTTEFSTNVCERPAWRYWRLNDPLCSELCSERCGDRCAKIANAFEWLGQPQKNAPSTWGSATHLTLGSFGPLESSSTTACRSVWPFCTAHCRVSYCFTLRYVSQKLPLFLGGWGPHLTHGTMAHPSHYLKRHLARFSRFCMSPKCYAVYNAL